MGNIKFQIELDIDLPGLPDSIAYIEDYCDRLTVSPLEGDDPSEDDYHADGAVVDAIKACVDLLRAQLQCTLPRLVPDMVAEQETRFDCVREISAALDRMSVSATRDRMSVGSPFLQVAGNVLYDERTKGEWVGVPRTIIGAGPYPIGRLKR